MMNQTFVLFGKAHVAGLLLILLSLPLFGVLFKRYSSKVKFFSLFFVVFIWGMELYLPFFTHSFSRLFNYRLRKAIRKQVFANSEADIKIFDNYSFFQSLADSEFFKMTLGKQCDGHTKFSRYYQTEGDTHNCFVDAKHDYLFWNNTHPSTLAHAKLARALSHWTKLKM